MSQEKTSAEIERSFRLTVSLTQRFMAWIEDERLESEGTLALEVLIAATVGFMMQNAKDMTPERVGEITRECAQGIADVIAKMQARHAEEMKKIFDACAHCKPHQFATCSFCRDAVAALGDAIPSRIPE